MPWAVLGLLQDFVRCADCNDWQLMLVASLCVLGEGGGWALCALCIYQMGLSWGFLFGPLIWCQGETSQAAWMLSVTGSRSVRGLCCLPWLLGHFPRSKKKKKQGESGHVYYLDWGILVIKHDSVQKQWLSRLYGSSVKQREITALHKWRRIPTLSRTLNYSHQNETVSWPQTRPTSSSQWPEAKSRRK